MFLLLTLNIQFPAGKLLSCLRLHFSHLSEHKFRRSFRDTTNPVCNCEKLNPLLNTSCVTITFQKKEKKFLLTSMNIDYELLKYDENKHVLI